MGEFGKDGTNSLDMMEERFFLIREDISSYFKALEVGDESSEHADL